MKSALQGPPTWPLRTIQKTSPFKANRALYWPPNMPLWLRAQGRHTQLNNSKNNTTKPP
jgi:hypothetical protein